MSGGTNGLGEVEGLGALGGEAGIATGAAGPTLDLANLAWLTSVGVTGITGVPGGTHLAHAIIGDSDGAEVTFDFYIPEPASMTMLGLGAVAMFLRRRRA